MALFGRVKSEGRSFVVRGEDDLLADKATANGTIFTLRIVVDLGAVEGLCCLGVVADI